MSILIITKVKRLIYQRLLAYITIIIKNMAQPFLLGRTINLQNITRLYEKHIYEIHISLYRMIPSDVTK